MKNTNHNTYHHGNLKEALVIAGLDILKRKGFDSLTLREVARQCDVSHNAPYRHFKNREELVQAIANKVGEKITLNLEQSILGYEEDPLTAFLEMAWAYTKFGIEHPDDFKVAFDGRMTNTNIPLLEALDMLVLTIQRAQNNNIFKTAPVMDQVIISWALVHGLATILIEPSIVPAFILTNTTKESLAKTVIKSIAEGWLVNK